MPGKKEDTTILKDRLYPAMEKSLKRNHQKLMSLISKFISDNSESLFANHPGGRVYYSAKIEHDMFDLCGVTTEEVTAVIAATELNEESWRQRNRTVFTLLALTLIYFAKKKKERKLVLMMLALTMYTGRQKKFFPYNTGAGFDNAMQYTVSNLSNKYLIKQKGNLHAALEATIDQSDKTYKRALEEATDRHIFAYTINLLNRIHNFVKNIASEFHDNKQNGRYINLERDTDPEEGNLLDVNNISFSITKATENSYLGTKTNKPDTKTIRIVAQSNKVSQVVLHNAIEKIVSEEDDNLKELFRLIVTVFLVDKRQTVEDICSSKFMLQAFKAYSKSHTKETNVIQLKENLGILLENHSAEYNKTQRIATKSSFKKALYLYFVTSIQRTVCGG